MLCAQNGDRIVKYTDIAKYAGHLPHCYGNSRAIWDHTVLPATRQRWHSRLYHSRSWYSIKRPRRDARLSWPSARRFCDVTSRYYYYYYLLRPKAAQHNITITKTEETQKKLKTKIHTKFRNNKANHTANETVVHGSVHNNFLEWRPDMQFNFKDRSGRKWTIV